ncbi:MAG TPA: dTMP kinase [Acidimicrobiales bacterium]|nr:dTMP kinase [Acidimicrobiales bacterium]
MRRGRFIVLEGGEASGKSTQAELLATSIGALLTREPGGTAAGEHIRALLLDPSLPVIVPRAEALLMMAARAQHVDQVIEPALAAGRHVVCDRFSGSTVAYQGYGRGLAPEELASLSAWASAGLEPDLVVLLTVPPDVARHRRASRGGVDKIESEVAAFHSRIDAGFAALASAQPDRWRVVDGSGSVEAVAARVTAAVASLL